MTGYYVIAVDGENGTDFVGYDQHSGGYPYLTTIWNANKFLSSESADVEMERDTNYIKKSGTQRVYVARIDDVVLTDMTEKISEEKTKVLLDMVSNLSDKERELLKSVL